MMHQQIAQKLEQINTTWQTRPHKSNTNNAESKILRKQVKLMTTYQNLQLEAQIYYAIVYAFAHLKKYPFYQ